MAIAVICSCGKELRVGDDHAGRKIYCPYCDRSLRIPDGTESPQAPAVRTSAAAPESAPSSSGKKVALAVAALAAASAVWWFFLRAENMSESAFLAPDSQALVSLRVADLAKNDTVNKLVQAQAGDPLAGVFARLGLDAAEVERFTYVGQNVEGGTGWAVIVTAKPIDQKAVLDKLIDVASYKHAGKRYHIGRIAGGFTATPTLFAGSADADSGVLLAGGKTGSSSTQQAVFFAGPSLLVLANHEAGMKAAIDSARRRSPAGELADAVKEIGGPKHFFAAFQPGEQTREKLRSDLILVGAGEEMADPPLKFLSGAVSVSVGEDVLMVVELTYPDAGLANEALKALKQTKEQLNGAKADGPEAKEVKLLKALAEGIQIDQRGSALSVKVKVPARALAEAVPQKRSGKDAPQ